jgi:DivIVA domain-containing protein
VLSAQDVHDKQFKLVRQSTGYDIDEVDTFLDEVEAAISDLTAQLEAARAERASAPAEARGPEPARADAAEGAGEGGTGAQPTAEQTTGSAARILELAQRTADEYVAEARRTADSLLAETEASARAAVAELESQRADLEARVGALRSFESQIRTRLTGYFEGQLRDLRSLGTPNEERPAES